MIRADNTYTLGKHQKDASQKQADELARMDKVVENSSEKNRNFFIAYLGLLIYVQAIIFSTTDLQLLVSTGGLKLPLIDLNVPLVGFYVVAPIFIIALHFNFLQNLESHHFKLMRWQELHPGGTVPRQYIFPFLFDYAILEQGSQFQHMVKIANSLLCYNLAPITLGLLLIRFSDRQDWLTTFWHYLAFLFDNFLVFKFRRALISNESEGKSSFAQSRFMPTIIKRSFRHVLGGLFSLLILFETLLTLAVGAATDDVFVRYIQPWLQPVSRFNPFQYASESKSKQISSQKKPWLEIIEQALSNPTEWILPRIAINRSETVWKPDVESLQVAAKLDRYSDWIKYFNATGQGFRPALHSLRFLQLPGQFLPRAQFANSKLQGANLEYANLQNANLSNAQVQLADLTGLSLQGADLKNVNLRGSKLTFAKLLGADLSNAQLQAVYLMSASLEGANLSETQLQGADLTYVMMDGAILHHTGMQGADFGFRLYGIPVNGLKMGTELFSTQVDWNVIKAVIDTLPASDERSALEYIFEKKINNDEELNKYFVYKPENIAATVLLKICKTHFSQKIVDVQAFRKRYSSVLHYDEFLPAISIDIYLSDLFSTPSAPPSVGQRINDIDKELCTIEACADIRDDIEGLDCKSFSQESAKATKAITKK